MVITIHLIPNFIKYYNILCSGNITLYDLNDYISYYYHAVLLFYKQTLIIYTVNKIIFRHTLLFSSFI